MIFFRANLFARVFRVALMALCCLPLQRNLLFSAQENPVPAQGDSKPQSATDQSPRFVEIDAEIETFGWPPVAEKSTERRFLTRCVVGKNSWLVANDFSLNSSNNYWFTGTNLVTQNLIVRKIPETLGWEAGNLPVGERFTHREDSVDGNPGFPPRVADEMDCIGRISWLAFCSSPCLDRDGHKLYPPNSLWKEYINATQFSEKTTRFKDDLGLPSSVLLFENETQTQPVLDYRVTVSTNMLGWNFPLQFYLAQYRPTGTTGWMLDFVAKGKVTSIRQGTEPSIKSQGRD